MQAGKKRYAVDRLEGDYAVLVDDDSGSEVVVPRAKLKQAKEGAMFNVSMRGSSPMWESAERDLRSEVARKMDMQKRTDAMRPAEPLYKRRIDPAALKQRSIKSSDTLPKTVRLP